MASIFHFLIFVVSRWYRRSSVSQHYWKHKGWGQQTSRNGSQHHHCSWPCWFWEGSWNCYRGPWIRSHCGRPHQYFPLHRLVVYTFILFIDTSCLLYCNIEVNQMEKRCDAFCFDITGEWRLFHRTMLYAQHPRFRCRTIQPIKIPITFTFF